MSTKPMKALVALASVALLGSLIAGADSSAFASGCGLTEGAGTEVNPWRVSSEEDFAKVGTAACTLASAMTYYRQSASFGINTSKAGVQVSETFAGVYDGDHWQITLDGGSDRPPFSTVSGTLKKLKLEGTLSAVSDEQGLGSLAKVLDNGTISEVGSTVSVTFSLPSAFSDSVGGLIGLSKSGLIQYSFFAGSVDVGSVPGSYDANIGGLVGARDGGVLWIRDSYSRASIEYDTRGSVQAGGLVGDARSTSNLFIRSYAAGSFTEGLSCPDGVDCGFRVLRVGGLLGNSTDSRNLTYVSAFWLESVGVNAVGGFGTEEADRSRQPLSYPTGFPVAVGVNAQTLSTLSTFQSKGDHSGPFGASTGDNSLPTGDSTPGATPSANDYRWAIESGNVETFVAQRRVDTANDNAGDQRVVGETLTFTRAFDRLLWSNSDVPEATYRTREASKNLPEGSYPDLGRVWEICSGVNNGYPVLVWEDRNCPSDGDSGGGGGTERNREKPADANVAAARAAGLSGAELEAFLASGLTLEQWLAQRLAATGTPGEVVNLGLLVAGMMTIIGLGLVVSALRQNRGRLARPNP